LAVPDSAILNEKNTMKVMYATDFYEEDHSSLNKLIDILDPFEKKIYCVHIDVDDDPSQEQKVEELNTMLEKKYSDQNIRCELFESKSIAQGFNDFVAINNIDVISFSKMKRSAFYKMFHPGHLSKLVSIEKVPVLIIPL
jgi:hypothetical protein